MWVEEEGEGKEEGEGEGKEVGAFFFVFFGQ